MSDQYLDIVKEQWGNILVLYKKFEDKKPVMSYDIQEQRISEGVWDSHAFFPSMRIMSRIGLPLPSAVACLLI
jgi:hypothetical protein